MVTKNKRISREERRNWRELPYEHWNTLTVHAYFTDKNEEMYGAAEYLPMRNWGFEQGAIKRALDQHGAEVLHRAFDEIFRTHRPSQAYPILTAGFAISYRLNTLIPNIKAEMERERSELGGSADIDVDEIIGYL